jgi:hypothetical protein
LRCYLTVARYFIRAARSVFKSIVTILVAVSFRP